MTFIKGGRGKKAPYDSTHVRTPEPIKPIADALIERFRALVVEEDLTVEQAVEVMQKQPFADCYSKEQILDAARFGLRQKKGAWVAMQKTLTSLFGDEVSIDDLTS